MYELEDGIEIPAKGNRKFPFAEMKVGQSFVVDQPIRRAASLAFRASTRLGFKFTTRKIDPSHTRIWRIK